MTDLSNALDDPKKLHDFLFELYDFAHLLQTKMSNTESSYSNNDVFYTFMAYIEDIMDIYGRQLIVESAKAAGIDERESLKHAHMHLDILRSEMSKLKELPASTDAIDRACRRIKNNWGVRE